MRREGSRSEGRGVNMRGTVHCVEGAGRFNFCMYTMGDQREKELGKREEGSK